jgi:2,3-bisphosphoglycerate-dependent phosphoglycerate mutase
MSFRLQRPFTFYFVRHGVTELNFRGLRCGGDLDIPLTDIGCDQAYLLAKQIQKMELGIDSILCGSLTRVRQTAMIINGVLGGLPMEEIESLNERKIGEWNRKTMAETEPLIQQRIPPPGGETEEQFRARVSLALDAVTAHSNQRPLVISSKGVGRVIHALLGGEGNLAVSNGEIVEFVVAMNGEGQQTLTLRRPSSV